MNPRGLTLTPIRSNSTIFQTDPDKTTLFSPITKAETNSRRGLRDYPVIDNATQEIVDTPSRSVTSAEEESFSKNAARADSEKSVAIASSTAAATFTIATNLLMTLAANDSKDERRSDELYLSDFEFGAKLGFGVDSEVYKVQHKTTGAVYVIKVCKKTTNAVQHVENEVSHLQRLSHPGIVSCLGAFWEKEDFFTLLEFADSVDLFEYVGKLSYEKVRHVAAQIVLVMEYLLEKRVLHRDLKPENILLDKRNLIKVIDFGFAKTLDQGKKATTRCGSFFYISPEVLQGKEYDFSSEVWSFGALLNAVCFRTTAFDGGEPLDPQRLLNDMARRTRDQAISVPRMYRDSPLYKGLLVNLIRSCLKWEPSCRPSIDQLKRHTFFQEHCEATEESIFHSKIIWNQVYPQAS